MCKNRGGGHSLSPWDVAFHNDGFQANADATHFSLFFLTDECPEEELTVRLFLRRVFLDPLGLPVSSHPSWADVSAATASTSPSLRAFNRSTATTPSTSTPSRHSSAYSSGYMSSGDPLASVISFRDDR